MSDKVELHEGLEAYIAFYRAGANEGLDEVTTSDVVRQDPFRKTSGRTAFRKVLMHLRANAGTPEVTIVRRAWDGDIAFVKWVCELRRGKRKPLVVEGVSELRFDERGRVRVHIDYWDASRLFYERFLVVGFLIRFIRKRLNSLLNK